MAIGFDPGDRAVEALLVVLIGLGKLGGKPGEVELELMTLSRTRIISAASSAPLSGAMAPPHSPRLTYTNIRLEVK